VVGVDAGRVPMQCREPCAAASRATAHGREKVGQMTSDRQKKRYEGFEKRLVHIGLGLVACFAVLAVRLWYLQVIHGNEFRRMAEVQRLHPQRLKAPRGMIYGHGDVVLADNRPACDIVLVPAECDDTEQVCRRLEALIGADAESLLEQVEAQQKKPFEQIDVKRDVTKSDLFRVEEHSYALPGVYTVASSQRRYLYGTVGGQILGYLGLNQAEPVRRRDMYRMGDWIGLGGIELVYENDLHGTDGHTVVTRYASGVPQLRTDVRGKPYIAEKDSDGNMLEEDYRVDPQMGKEVRLVLDIDLQAKAEALLGQEVGAIVVLNADTGEVYALASTPGFDPNAFTTRTRSEERDTLLKTEAPNPMVSRAYREVYAPGSVFKVMLAAAALEAGTIDENTTFFCPGYYQIDGQGRKWRCWRHSGHGRVAVVDALAFSCDVFFYNVGLRLGVDKINEYARKLGLGVETGIDLPREESGFVPSKEWYETVQRASKPKEPWEWVWRAGDTLNTSIGQGFVVATPLQCATLVAAIVNGGSRVKPYLNVDRGSILYGPFLSEKTVELVRAGMRKCVEKDDVAPTGTGKEAKIPGMAVIGKTGSAQVVALQQYEDYASEKDIPYSQRDHAWFVAGVLDKEPRIAVSILVEHGLHGSSAAAPLAKEIIQYFYTRQSPQVVLAREGKGR